MRYAEDVPSFIEGIAQCVQRVYPGSRLYLASNLVIVAESDNDLEKFLYTSIYPSYIDLEKVSS